MLCSETPTEHPMNTNDRNASGLTDWGFIFKSPGGDRHVFNTAGFRTRSAGVATVEDAVEVAKAWADDGVQLIELCGWFGPDGAAEVVAAVGETVAVGYVIPTPETENIRKKVFRSDE